MSNKKLYVGNLPFNTTEDELKSIFEECGKVISAKIITDRETGRSKGFAFVEMNTPEEAIEAINRFNGALYKERPIKVTEAKPPEENRNRNGGGGFHRNASGASRGRGSRW
jgi:RNA recognition motif-containing protein